MAQAKITVTGRRKLCRSHAGDSVLPAIVQIAWGDGGVEEDGEAVKDTTGNEVGLYHELLRKNIESHTYLDENETSCRYTGTIEKDELIGKELSEMGLYDADGDLVAYKTFMKKGKDEDIVLIFDMDEIF
ncbi:phage tail protein [Clostridium sp. AM58-1XD]|uniref:phage tail protein n=1 Tax=Clostridium sp. AM58-1XD TaxID=2292307 RepID=UPI000E4A7AAA|nr:phage tail protein [Clostridium sp. AM58-1XD]RGY95372.1 hypothetical protein DXA13_19320 [Clostridium sp. AM58-1XD]